MMNKILIVLVTTIVNVVITSGIAHWYTLDLWATQCTYIAVRKRIDLGYPKSDELFEVKANICMGIIQSEFMNETYNLDPVNMSDEIIYAELRKKYPGILTESGFVNPYRSRDITTIDDEHLQSNNSKAEIFHFREWVFSCLARERTEGKIVEYFISQEYKLNPSSPNSIIRLIFGFDDNEGKAIVPLGEAHLFPTASVTNYENTTQLFAFDRYSDLQESEKNKIRVLETMRKPKRPAGLSSGLVQTE